MLERGEGEKKGIGMRELISEKGRGGKRRSRGGRGGGGGNESS